jgi:hypothetical protein
VVCRSHESQEKGKKGDLVGLSQQHTMLKTTMLKTKELTVLSSLTQSKENGQIVMKQIDR